MTEPSSRRRPGPGLVIWGSVALFAVLFAMLTSQLAASPAPQSRPVLVRQVVKRKVVTTFVPTPGKSTVSASGPVASEIPTEYAPVATSSS